ncbi:hypothetical protein AB0I27_22455 [Streptomyces sp. NPDC050597]|uniref:hypothetical protein n=1 Tax=Streptomyces sp. NPDC050597 TaxID=3157212 RepID=UPI00343B3145
MARRQGDVDSGWTLDTFHTHVTALLAEMDRRYEQRYEAQQKALEAALLAAEKAVQTAMVAAEKATSKAADAADKRIEALNELRGIVNDIGSLQMPRREAEERLRGLAEKLDELKVSYSQTTSQTAGHSAGLNAGWAYLLASIGAVATVIAVVLSLNR